LYLNIYKTYIDGIPGLPLAARNDDRSVTVWVRRWVLSLQSEVFSAPSSSAWLGP